MWEEVSSCLPIASVAHVRDPTVMLPFLCLHLLTQEQRWDCREILCADVWEVLARSEENH